MSGNKLLAATFEATWKKCSAENECSQQADKRDQRQLAEPLLYSGPGSTVFLPFPALRNLCEPVTPFPFSPQFFYTESLPMWKHYNIEAEACNGKEQWHNW